MANIYKNGRDMQVIQRVCRPIWDNFLKDFGISEDEAEANDWNFEVFTEEVALDLRVADQRN